jgi:hypothetical protein
MFFILGILALCLNCACAEQPAKEHQYFNAQQPNPEMILREQNNKLDSVESNLRFLKSDMHQKRPNPLVGTTIIAPFMAGFAGQLTEKMEPSIGAATFISLTILGIVSFYRALDANRKEKELITTLAVNSGVHKLIAFLKSEKLNELPRGKELLIELDKASAECKAQINKFPKQKIRKRKG